MQGEGEGPGHSRTGCHPGIPRNEDFEKDYERWLAEHGRNDHIKTGDSAKPGPIVMGTIVERNPPSFAVRPPNAPAPASASPSTFSQHGHTLSNGAADKSKWEDREREEIEKQNSSLIESMSTEEILAEQERLKEILPAKLYQKWSRS